jgi:DNA-directed RNA polymerase omega subunit
VSAHLADIAQYALPSDPEQSRFRFIIVAGKRARQLHRGHRPFVPTGSKKPARMAMYEARNGLIPFEIEEE